VSEVLLFSSQFVVVLLLVVQSINNNHGRVMLGAFTSLFIGVAQIATFKLLPDASWSEAIAWIAAGPVANVVAQWIKRKDIEKIRRLS
jgi:predicted MFS family arabinose efflux permease